MFAGEISGSLFALGQQYHTEHFHCPINPLCPPIHPSPQITTDLFTVSIVLPFPECHIIEIIQYVAFSDWLLLLRNKYLWYLRVFSWL